MSPPNDATVLLAAIHQGDPTAAEKLLALIYQDLHAQARAYFRGQPADHTLQPTALVNEAFLRLIDPGNPQFNNRRHFLAVAATAMRQILTDHARRARAQKRGGERQQVNLEVAEPGAPDRSGIDLIALEDALEKLARFDPRQYRIVELRFFGGLTMDEIAEEIGMSKASVELDWRAARAWLHVELNA